MKKIFVLLLAIVLFIFAGLLVFYFGCKNLNMIQDGRIDTVEGGGKNAIEDGRLKIGDVNAVEGGELRVESRGTNNVVGAHDFAYTDKNPDSNNSQNRMPIAPIKQNVFPGVNKSEDNNVNNLKTNMNAVESGELRVEDVNTNTNSNVNNSQLSTLHRQLNIPDYNIFQNYGFDYSLSLDKKYYQYGYGDFVSISDMPIDNGDIKNDQCIANIVSLKSTYDFCDFVALECRDLECDRYVCEYLWYKS